MRKTFFLILIPLLLWSSTVLAVVEPRAEVVDDFEAYADSAELNTAWPPFDGEPVLSLADIAHAGDSSMRMDYDVRSGAMVNWVSYELPDETNWSDMVTFSLWYQGLETNSSDTLSLQILNAGNQIIFQDNLPGAAANAGWNRWDTTVTGNLAAADAVVIGVEASTSEIPGVGIIYLDDISVTNHVQTIWQGYTADWHDPANWNRGVPNEFADARVPAAPPGGLQPVVSSGVATAHDLIIMRRATLDLGSSDLDLSGTLDNQGAVIRTEAVGSNSEKSFLLDGGHPGVTISTIQPPQADATAAASSLGATSVAIKAGRCDDGGGSIKRCYDITPDNPESATITFFFSQADLDGQACEELALYNYTGSTWQEVAGPDDANISYQCQTANFSVTVSGISDYSPFLLSDAVPVAITLQNLSAASPVSLSPAIIAAGLLALTTLVLLRRRRS